MLFFKRLILFIIGLLLIISSITISGLNTEKVLLDLYFIQSEISIGFLIILTLFIGLLIGLLMSLFSFHMPLKSQLRKLSRKNKELLSEKRLEISND
jgi:uncharacterized membrane protein YciS (DUF1049 family)